MTENHYAYARPADPVGLCKMYEPYCSCGWIGKATDVEREAEVAARQHSFYNTLLSRDDYAWLTGTGRFAQ